MATIKSKYKNKSTGDIYHFETEASATLDKSNTDLQSILDGVGTANGLASLSSEGLIDLNNLPSADLNKNGILQLTSEISNDENLAAAPNIVSGVNTAINNHKNSLDVHGASSEPNPNSIVKRDSEGNSKISTPLNSNEIANKDYVNDSVFNATKLFSTNNEALNKENNSSVMSPFTNQISKGTGYYKATTSGISGNSITINGLPADLQTSGNKFTFYLSIPFSSEGFTFTSDTIILTNESSSVELSYYFKDWSLNNGTLSWGYYICSTYAGDLTHPYEIGFIKLSSELINYDSYYIKKNNINRLPKYYKWADSISVSPNRRDVYLFDSDFTTLTDGMIFSFRCNENVEIDNINQFITFEVNASGQKKVYSSIISGEKFSKMSIGSYYSFRYDLARDCFFVDHSDKMLLSGISYYDVSRNKYVCYSRSFWKSAFNKFYTASDITDSDYLRISKTISNAVLSANTNSTIEFVGDFNIPQTDSGIFRAFVLANGITLDFSAATLSININLSSVNNTFNIFSVSSAGSTTTVPPSTIIGLKAQIILNYDGNINFSGSQYLFDGTANKKLRLVDSNLNITVNLAGGTNAATLFGRIRLANECKIKNNFIIFNLNSVLKTGLPFGTIYINSCELFDNEIKINFDVRAGNTTRLCSGSYVTNTNIDFRTTGIMESTYILYGYYGCFINNGTVNLLTFMQGKGNSTAFHVYYLCPLIKNINIEIKDTDIVDWFLGVDTCAFYLFNAHQTTSTSKENFVWENINIEAKVNLGNIGSLNAFNLFYCNSFYNFGILKNSKINFQITAGATGGSLSFAGIRNINTIKNSNINIQSVPNSKISSLPITLVNPSASSRCQAILDNCIVVSPNDGSTLIRIANSFATSKMVYILRNVTGKVNTEATVNNSPSFPVSFSGVAANITNSYFLTEGSTSIHPPVLLSGAGATSLNIKNMNYQEILP